MLILIAAITRAHVVHNRLFAGNQAGRHGVDPDVPLVDGGFIVRNLVRVVRFALHKRQHASVDRLRNHPAHVEQSFVQNQEFFFKSTQKMPPTRTVR